jgi:DNA-binding beta-propeller fold protein YncE
MWIPTVMDSTIVAGGNGYGYSSSLLIFIYGLTVDSSTNTIYVANSQTNTIIAWAIGATAGTIIAGSNVTFGGADFLLNYPRDVKCDQYRNLYVAGSNNNRILLFCQNPSSTSGRIIAGYHLSYPESITLDSDLHLYVLSSNINQVQKYTRIV